MVIKMSLLKIIKDFFDSDESKNEVLKKEVLMDESKKEIKSKKKTSYEIMYCRCIKILLKEKSYFKDLNKSQQNALISNLFEERKNRLNYLIEKRQRIKKINVQQYNLVNQKCSDIERDVMGVVKDVKRLRKIKNYFLEKGIEINKIYNLRQLKKAYLDVSGIDLSEPCKRNDESYLSEINELDNVIKKKKDELKELSSEKIIVNESRIEQILINDIKNANPIISRDDAVIIVKNMLKNYDEYRKEIENARAEILQDKSENRGIKITHKIDEIDEVVKKKQNLERELVDLNNSFNLIESKKYYFEKHWYNEIRSSEFFDKTIKTELSNKECEDYINRESFESLPTKDLRYYFPEGLEGILKSRCYYVDLSGPARNGFDCYISGYYYKFNKDILPENDLELFNEYKSTFQTIDKFLSDKKEEIPSKGNIEGHLGRTADQEIDRIISFIDELRYNN